MNSVYFIAFIAAALAAFASFPIWRTLCLRFNLVDDPGDRKIHGQSMPLAGGLTVLAGIALPAVIGLSWIFLREAPQGSPESVASILHAGISARAAQLSALFIGAAGMLIVGLLDDRHELRPSIKFACQFLVALLVAASGVRVTLFVPSVLFSFVITILWILTVINAFNFMDNMNGLCAGIGAIASMYFAFAAIAAEQNVVAIIALLACGGLVGFLPHNFPSARAFLGDSGSHFVGYLMAVLAILPSFYTPENPRGWAVLGPLFILAVPLLDLVHVVLIRWRLRRPFYIGDNNHLSHRLVRHGWSRVNAVVLIWFVAAAIGAAIFAF